MPEEIVRHRYEEGLRNFFTRYREIVDRWHLFDNEGNVPLLVAKGTGLEGVRILDLQKWSTLEERSGV